MDGSEGAMEKLRARKVEINGEGHYIEIGELWGCMKMDTLTRKWPSGS